MSGDLTNLSLSLFDQNNLSENLSGALRLCEVEPGGSGQHTNRGEPSRNEIENMSTESITKITLDTYNKITWDKNGNSVVRLTIISDNLLRIFILFL